MVKKKNGLSREQAAELYQDLQRSMAKMLKNEAAYYKSNGQSVPAAPGGVKVNLSKDSLKSVSAKTSDFSRRLAAPMKGKFNRGSTGALILVLTFSLAKVVMSAMEFSGLAQVESVEASYLEMQPRAKFQGPHFTKEELQVLTSLDSRRAELEDRSKRLDERESDLQKKDKEFAVRLTQLRELNDRLKNDREKNERKQSGQLDQLANVYGSMNPQEASKLMEQLDIVTAMSLIERMPEKRIAQILALMSSERALEITKMLSGRQIR